MERKCQNCFCWQYLETHGDLIVGYCRRRAPAIDRNRKWPDTLSTEWCGEWIPKAPSEPLSDDWIPCRVVVDWNRATTEQPAKHRALLGNLMCPKCDCNGVMPTVADNKLRCGRCKSTYKIPTIEIEEVT